MNRLFVFLLAIFLLIGGYFYWAIRDLPSVKNIAVEGVNPSKWTQVLGADGTPILSYGKFHHNPVELREISPHFIDALLATEDRRFYNHSGVDLFAIFRALVRDVTQRRFVEGGSTLTQQLARNVFLSNERSFRRKIREAAVALKLEHELSKDEILELYVNYIYFGEGAYGIHAASEIYFDKKPSQLTVEEAALLAGLPQAPSRYSPFNSRENAKKRQMEVLQNLVEVGKIKKEALASYQKKSLYFNPEGRSIGRSNRAPFFNQYVMKQVMEHLDLDEQGFWQSGLKIHTTLDPRAQNMAEQAVRRQSEAFGRTRNYQQASLISITPQTGAIIAYVGGKDFSTSQFDRVSQAVRSPGSTFKIFTYTTAIEKGYHPYRVYLDEPIAQGEWVPENYDKGHHGYMTIAQALAFSNNIVAVKVLQEITPDAVVEMAHKMGLKANLNSNLSLTLGGSGVTLLDITSAVGVLADKGVRAEPYAVEKVVDRNGKTLFKHQPLKTNVLNRSTVDTMVKLLQGVVQHGTGKAANIGVPVAGKTGTSDENRDGWFIGFTPNIITGVWVGNDDNSPVPGLAGGGMPATIWAAYMRPYVSNKLPVSFETDHGEDVTEGMFTTYDLQYLSEFEATNPLVKAGRMLPAAEEPQLDESDNPDGSDLSPAPDSAKPVDGGPPPSPGLAPPTGATPPAATPAAPSGDADPKKPGLIKRIFTRDKDAAEETAE